MTTSFDDFKKMAKDKTLSSYEKVGFQDVHRKDTEANIFPDILSKLSIEKSHELTILDIGCGCSLPAKELIRYSEQQQHKLVLLDSSEMLEHLPESVSIIEKATHEFPKDDKFLEHWHEKFDVIICYSLLQILFPYQNIFTFVDKAVSLLKDGGKMLVGDIANVTKKKRFLSSKSGIEFHKKWSGDDTIPQVDWNDSYLDIDDSVVIQLLQRYRSMGMETYLLPQPDGLPMNQTREDILICKR